MIWAARGRHIFKKLGTTDLEIGTAKCLILNTVHANILRMLGAPMFHVPFLASSCSSKTLRTALTKSE